MFRSAFRPSSASQPPLRQLAPRAWLPLGAALVGFLAASAGEAATLSFRAGDGGLHSNTDATFIQGRAGVDFSAGGPDTAYGASDFLVVDDDPPGSAGNPEIESLARTLLRFPDVIGAMPGQVPAGSTVTNASITLTTLDNEFAPTGAGLSVHRVLVDWEENALTWNSFGNGGTPGSQFSAAALTQFNPGSANTAFAIDVTSALVAWSGGDSNFGVILTSGSDDAALFASDDHPVLGVRPRLDVDFIPVPEAGSFLLLGFGLLGLALQLRSGS